jgi:hypothetical protein
MTTSEIEDASDNAMNREVILVDRFIRGIKDSEPVSLGIESNISVTCNEPLVDIDSFFYVAKTKVPLARNYQVQLLYRPDFKHSITSDTGITTSIRSIDNGRPFPLEKCPNLLLARCGDVHVSKLLDFYMNGRFTYMFFWNTD